MNSSGMRLIQFSISRPSVIRDWRSRSYRVRSKLEIEYNLHSFLINGLKSSLTLNGNTQHLYGAITAGKAKY